MEDRVVGVEVDPLYTDELTGCLNRRYVKEFLGEKLQLIKTENRAFSMALIDIDRLKDVNDTYGHLMGDRLIREFAQFLRSSVRPYDYVVRLGGDEFICVMPDAREREAIDICVRLQERSRQRKIADSPLTMSIGIATYPEDGHDFETLLTVADNALYDAKRRGRDRIGAKHKKSLEIPLRAFVDRASEKEALRTLIVHAGGQERWGIIRGNVGIGKTRLVREILSVISSWEILWADCIPFSDSISYYPIRELLKYKLRRRTMEIMHDMPFVYRLEIAKLIPGILEDVEHQRRLTDLVLDKYRLYEGIRYLLSSGTAKTILVLDNAQWIDQESIEVLKYLSRSMEKTNTVIIFIIRNGITNRQMEDFIVFISREIPLKEIELHPFGENDIKKSISLILGEEPERELVSFLAEESGGNPYYIEEIMRELSENDHLYIEDDRWRFLKPQRPLIPKSLEDIGQLRYHALSTEARAVLEAASVIGYFDVAMLQSLTGYNEGHVIGLVDDVRRAGFTKKGQDKDVFNDQVTRKSVYRKNVEGPKSKRLHQMVGDLLEERFRGKVSAVIEELALHFYRAGDTQKGIDYCVKSATRAREKFASQDAIRYYRWALEMMPPEDPAYNRMLASTWLLDLGGLHEFVGEYEAAIQHYGEAFGIAADDTVMKARAKNRIAGVYRILGKLEESLAAIDEAELLLAGDSGEGMAERIESLTQRSWVCQLKGDIEASVKHAELALSILDELPVDEKAKARWEAKVHEILGRSFTIRSEFDQAVVAYQKCLRASETCYDKQGAGKAYANLVSVYLTLSRYDDAEKLLVAALTVAEEIGDIKNIGVVNRLWGTLSQAKGDFDAALEYYNKNHAIARRIGDSYGVAMANNQIGTIHLYRNEYEDARDHFERYLRISEEIGYQQGVCEANGNLGSIYLTKMDFEKAIQYYNQSLPCIEKMGNVRVAAIIKTNLASAYNYLGNYDKTMALYKDALNISETTELKSMICIILCNMGEMASDRGNHEEAEELYHRALTIAEDVEDKLTRAEILHNLAVLHMDRGELASAAEYLAESERGLRDIGSRERLIDVSLRQASLKSMQGVNENEIDEHLRKARELAEELDSTSGKAGFHLTVGRILRDRGDQEEALSHLHTALRLFQELKWRKMIGEAVFECGITLSQAQREEEAGVRFREARDLFEEISLENRVKQIDQQTEGLRE